MPKPTDSRLSRRIPGAALGSLVALLGMGVADAAPYDLVINHARVIDGTGTPAFAASVGVTGDTIAEIRRGDAALKGRRVIDAGGRVLAPGFIDSHAHGDPRSMAMVNFLTQGVTTVVLGQDGVTPGSDNDDPAKDVSFAMWRDAVNGRGADVNIVALSGFGTLRNHAGIGAAPSATPEQIAAMAALLKADLAAGTFGMSSGLEYVPDRYASLEELTTLADVVGVADGVVESHMRSEDDDRIDAALDELIAQGRRARVHVSHIKVVLGHGAARGEAVLARLEKARAGGVTISADVYPYLASSADFALDYPPWARRRGEFEAAVKTDRTRLEAAIHDRVMLRNGPGAIIIEDGPDGGLTVEAAARKAGKPFAAYMIDAGYGGPGAAHFVMDQALQDVFITDPKVALSSDGGPEIGHPRSWGSFSTIIEDAVGRRRLLTLEAAVRKGTDYPARDILHLTDRGRVAAGLKADLILFDPARVHTVSTWAKVEQPAQGFDEVIVGGKVAWEAGHATGVRAGRVLAPPSKP